MGMFKISIDSRKYFLVCFLTSFIGICLSCNGFVSGYFKLDAQSKLPAWFHNSNNIPREKLNIKIIIFETTTSTKGKVKVIISYDDKIIKEAEGLWWYHPKSLKKSIPAEPPSWAIIEINGIKEIYEQRGNNNILKIIDNVDEKSIYS